MSIVVFTLIGMPAYFAFVSWMAIKPQIAERLQALKSLTVLAVVDSSGLYHGARREIRTEYSPGDNPFSTTSGSPQVQWFRTEVHLYPDQKTATDSLKAGRVSQVLVIPPDYLATGKLRRYASQSGLFSSGADRPVTRWLVANLLADRVDSMRIERVLNRMTMRLKIISGGQTGVDRAALDAALACGVECGGWCRERPDRPSKGEPK